VKFIKFAAGAAILFVLGYSSADAAEGYAKAAGPKIVYLQQDIEFTSEWGGVHKEAEFDKKLEAFGKSSGGASCLWYSTSEEARHSRAETIANWKAAGYAVQLP
jgi:hypothetical protein